MKRLRFLRRRDPVASLSWRFEGKPADGPESSLSWHFEEAPGDGPVASFSWRFEVAVRTNAPTDIDPAVASVHIAAAAQAARSAPLTRPDGAAAAGRSGKRRLALAGMMSSITAKVLLGTVAVMAATGGAAAANLLPDPVQGVVSDAAALVGVNWPSPDDELVVGDDLDDQSDETRLPPPVEDDQGEDADDQGGDADEGSDVDADDQGDDADEGSDVDADDQGEDESDHDPGDDDDPGDGDDD